MLHVPLCSREEEEVEEEEEEEEVESVQLQGGGHQETAYREHAEADLLAKFPFQRKADAVRAVCHHRLNIQAVRHLTARANSRKKLERGRRGRN